MTGYVENLVGLVRKRYGRIAGPIIRLLMIVWRLLFSERCTKIHQQPKIVPEYCGRNTKTVWIASLIFICPVCPPDGLSVF
jgi:hypothetical protein